MEPGHHRAQVVELDELHAGFLAGFASAEPAPSYLLRDVDVVWTRAPAPGAQRAAGGATARAPVR